MIETRYRELSFPIDVPTTMSFQHFNTDNFIQKFFGTNRWKPARVETYCEFLDHFRADLGNLIAAYGEEENDCQALPAGVAVLLLAACRVGTTKFHYWEDCNEFLQILDQPTVFLHADENADRMQRRLLRFCEIFLPLCFSVPGIVKRLGSWQSSMVDSMNRDMAIRYLNAGNSCDNATFMRVMRSDYDYLRRDMVLELFPDAIVLSKCESSCPLFYSLVRPK